MRIVICVKRLNEQIPLFCFVMFTKNSVFQQKSLLFNIIRVIIYSVVLYLKYSYPHLTPFSHVKKSPILPAFLDGGTALFIFFFDNQIFKAPAGALSFAKTTKFRKFFLQKLTF